MALIEKMEPVATFEKISFDQFVKDFVKDYDGVPLLKEGAVLLDVYNNIHLPLRKTDGSAGYDFFSPVAVHVSGSPITLPTGIRVKIEPGYFMACYPRSGLGFKYGMRLENTTGIIDSDYYYANNEGHIMARISANRSFDITEGDRFMQGIFQSFGISTNGNGNEQRVGGIGSTGR